MRARLLLLAVVLGIVPIVWLGACLLAGPSDGTSILAARASSWTAAGLAIDQVHGDTTPLHAGDVVVAVDGVPVADVDALSRLPKRQVGDVVTYAVRREGVIRDVEVPLTRYPIRDALLDNVPAVLLAGALIAVASFAFARSPCDRTTLVLVVMALLLVLGGVSWPLGPQVIDLAGGRGLWPAAAGEIADAALWATWLLFALIAPTPYPWVRRRPALAVAGVLAVVFGAYALRVASAHDAVGLDRVAVLLGVSFPASRLLPVPLVVALVFALRRTGRGASTRGMRLVLIALIMSLAMFFLVGHLPLMVWGDPLVAERWQPFVLVVCPIVAALAVARYRLFDIDVIVRRSLVYGLVSVGLLASYVGSCVAIGGVLGWSSPAWVIGGAVAAVCFQPLRTRLRSLAGRIAFGARDNPYEVISRLGQQVEQAHDPEDVLPVVVDTLSHALRLSYAAIELRDEDDSYTLVAARGVALGSATVMPLRHGDVVIGRLRLEVVSGVEPFNHADERLLDDLARQVASAVRLVQLNAGLQRSVERLVRAREAERRRLACDLHDGLGPTLAAGIIQLGVARSLVREDPDSAEMLLDGIVGAAQDMVVDVRRIVDDLRPPALDELGLVAAIEQRARYFAQVAGSGAGTMRVEVVARGDLDSLPPAVEVAAYRIVLEALHNACRHGRAAQAVVRLDRDQGLQVTVADDGVGVASDAMSGVGVTSMRNRAAELGGSMEIVSGEGTGTIVRARLPLNELVLVS